MQGQPRILRQAVWMGLASVALLVGKSSGGIRAAPPPDPKTLEIQPEDLQRARAWVEQLGSPVYTEREQAQTELARMGRLARLALQEALASHPDPEVRQRCAVLLPAAIEDDIKVRLTVFLADTAGRYTHQLPGWEAFRAIACNEWRWCGWVLARDASLEPAARKLYAEMLQTPANRDLLFASENPHASISQLLTERRLELIHSRTVRNVIINGQVVALPPRSTSPADWLTVLFLEQLIPATVVNNRVASMAASLLNSPLQSLLRQQDATGQVVRNVVANWALSRRDPQDMYYLFIQAPNLELHHLTTTLAMRLLKHPGAPIGYKSTALNRLAVEATPQLVPFLESLFDDTSVIINMTVVRNVQGQQTREVISIQLRDAALALALHLSQRSPTDYGFVDRGGVPANAPPFQYTRYYFPDEKVRQRAFERYQRERPASSGPPAHPRSSPPPTDKR